MDAPPQDLESVLSTFAVELWAMNEDEAQELAESEKVQAIVDLMAILNEAAAAPRIARFALNSSTAGILQGSSFVELNAPENEEAIGLRRRLQHDDLLKFLRGLTWDEFEACCKGILDVLGCVDPKVTRLGNDQGIDFFGTLPLKGRLANSSLLPGLDSNLNIWMVGQAKHYAKTKVSTPDLRELVGSIQLARAKAYADGGTALRDLDMKMCDPVFYLFFTTGTISADGKRLLKESGMVSLDGSQVATYLADNEVASQNGQFDEVTARAWIERHRA